MAYTPREIDATRGLPNFDQMVQAAQSRNTLGQTINQGVQDVTNAQQFQVKKQLAQTEAAKNQAEAGYYGRKESLVDINTLPPEMQKQAASSVQVDPVTGQRGIPVSSMKSIYDNVNADLKQQLADTASKAQSALAQKDTDIAKVNQQLADEKAAHGKAALASAGLQTAAETGSKAKPGTMEDIDGAITNKFATSLTSTLAPGYQAQQTGLAAQKQLVGQSAPQVPQSNGIPRTNAPLTPTSTFTPAPPPPTSNPQYPLGGAPNPASMPPAQVGPIPDKANTFQAMSPVNTGTPQPQSTPAVPVGGQKPVPVYTQEDYDALPQGAVYVDSEGQKVKGQK
jgi:hypothetical protein